MQSDSNSIIYTLLSQLNTKIYENKTLMHTLVPYYLLDDRSLQFYLEQFRDIDVLSRSGYAMEDGLYIG
jgi:hypothetical protein